MKKEETNPDKKEKTEKEVNKEPEETEEDDLYKRIDSNNQNYLGNQILWKFLLSLIKLYKKIKFKEKF